MEIVNLTLVLFDGKHCLLVFPGGVLLLEPYIPTIQPRVAPFGVWIQQPGNGGSTSLLCGGAKTAWPVKRERS